MKGSVLMQSQAYSLTKTFTYPNAIIRVYRPDLAEEERNKRMKAIHNATIKILKEVVKNEH